MAQWQAAGRRGGEARGQESSGHELLLPFFLLASRLPSPLPPAPVAVGGVALGPRVAVADELELADDLTLGAQRLGPVILGRLRGSVCRAAGRPHPSRRRAVLAVVAIFTICGSKGSGG